MIFPVAYFFKKLKLITLLVYDDADFLPIFAKGFTKKLMSILESFAVSKSDMVISASEILARLRRGKNSLTYVVENGFSKRLCRDFTKGATSINNCNFVYVGNIDFTYVTLDTVIKAFKSSEALKNSKLYIVGRGKDLPKLYEMVVGLDNVILTSYTNIIQQLSIFEKSIFGLAPYHISGHAKFGDPLKVKEYLASGLCVIVSDIKPIIDFIKNVDGCYYVIKDPLNEEHVKKVLEEALISCTKEGVNLLRKIERSSTKVCNLYSWDRLIVKYVMYVNKLVKEFMLRKKQYLVNKNVR
ncbi:MAG: glycosyltransferase [Desulfurococcaceae archaeon]